MSDLNVIKKIEKLIGEPLKPCPADSDIMDWDQQNTFLLDSQQQVTGLNIRSNGINDISVLKALPNLTDLDLSQNQIIDLSALNALPNLTRLNLRNNLIRDISVLKALPNLTQLDLSTNTISDISVLKALPNLTELSLWRNQISDISVLKSLPKLTRLNLSFNPIRDISVLKALPNLIRLDLRDNQISDISVLKALPKLTRLNLSFNPIRDISVLKALPNLIRLDLSHNQISDISVLKSLPNLTRLDLSQNQISELPEWLLNLNIPIRLDGGFGDGIFLENNPIEKPPLEIIKQGTEAIRAYFEQLRKEGFDTIYEAKLILVGEGGAGKTSLANKIINPDWQLIPEIKSESTKGIDILSYKFPFKDKTFRVNIWDFGGQEIYHQTHQFFLSKRALYFLLTDDRKEDTDFYHWLNIVDLLSANSPVVIIKNEKSKRSRDIPEQELKEFNNIKAILATDLSDNRGLDKIIKDLQYYITELPHIGAPLPKTWVKVREQLEQDDRYYIDLKDYFALCQANGFEKEADKLQLSEYLHDLGVCLHFQNHPLLRKTLILKPTWATDAVYKVLDNDSVKNQAGHFNDKDLADIWQDEQYNTMRGELLALMQKFKLCYEIRNQPHHYIAPQLLKDKAPQYDWRLPT